MPGYYDQTTKKKGFSSGMLAILPLPPNFQIFSRSFHNALDLFASNNKV